MLTGTGTEFDREGLIGAEAAGRDVHVDWHMTRTEWHELRVYLMLHANDSLYIRALHSAGKLSIGY